MSVTNIDITCSPDAGVTQDEVMWSHLFRQWIMQFAQTGPKTRLVGVDVRGSFYRGEPKDIKMLQIVARSLDKNGELVARLGVLRDPTVDLLTVIDDGTGPHVVFALQDRLLAAHDLVLSNPAGALDRGEDPAAAARREQVEEFGGVDGIAWGEVINLVEAATRSSRPTLVSPGVTNEMAWHFAVEGITTPERLDELVQQSGGLKSEGEVIKLIKVRLEDALTTLPQYGLADEKTLCSIVLFERYRWLRQNHR